MLLRRIHRNIPEDKPDFVSGCAMLIERSEFDAIGGFDERFFMYFEDVELCWRLRKNGKYAYRCLTAHVTHLGGKSYRDHSSQRDDYAEAQDLLFRVMSTPKPAIQLLRAARSVWRFTLAVRSATARVMQNPAA